MIGLTAFVTGAAGGIGKATVQSLCKKGINVIAIDSSSPGLDNLMSQVEGEITPICLDVADWKETEDSLGNLIKEFGTPDYLVNGAGINPQVENSGHITHQFYTNVMDINFAGTFLLCKIIIPLMASAKRGAVVNIASVAGMRGWGGSSVYSASKGAMIALTKSFATEYGRDGVRVNAVCPGSIRTPMVLNNLEAKNNYEEGIKAIAEEHPLGRIGEPAEVADAIEFLLSDKASFITGSILTVDGGISAS